MQDCGQLHALGETETGIYKVRPNPAIENDIYVYCDHDTDGGGWLIYPAAKVRYWHTKHDTTLALVSRWLWQSQY